MKDKTRIQALKILGVCGNWFLLGGCCSISPQDKKVYNYEKRFVSAVLFEKPKRGGECGSGHQTRDALNNEIYAMFFLDKLRLRRRIKDQIEIISTDNDLLLDIITALHLRCNIGGTIKHPSILLINIQFLEPDWLHSLGLRSFQIDRFDDDDRPWQF